MATKIIDDCGCKRIINISDDSDCGCNSSNSSSITNPSPCNNECNCSSFFPVSVANGGTGSTAFVNNGILYYTGGRVTNNNSLTYNGSFLTYKDGNQSNGYVLTCDANGQATWQSAGGGIPTLTATQIAFGDSGNLMTSSSDFTWDDTGKVLLVTDGLSIDVGNLSYSIGDIGFVGNGQFIALSDSLKLLNVIADNGASFSGSITGFSYLQVGNNSGSPTAGRIDLIGSTSGQVSVQTPAAPTTWTLTLPTTAGTANYFLQTNGSGVSTWAQGLTPGTGWAINGNTLGNDTSWLGSIDNHDVLFKTNNTTRVTILKSGEIGVNTSPVSSSIISIKGTGTTSSTFGVKVFDSASNLNFYVRDDGAINSRLGYWLTSYDGVIYNDNKFVHQGSGRFQENVYLGVLAGSVDVATSDGNIGIGFQALKNATVSGNCIAIGRNSLLSQTAGYSNVSIGPLSFATRTDGQENIGIGYAVFSNQTSGNRNVVIGAQIGNGGSLTTAERNVIVGSNSIGGSITALNYSTLLGCELTVRPSTMVYSIGIGKGVEMTADHQLVVGGYQAYVTDGYFGAGVDAVNDGFHNFIPFTFHTVSAKAGDTDRDASAAIMTMAPGAGSGTGLGADFRVMVAPAGSTGSTVNTLVEALRVNQAKSVIIGDSATALATTATDGFLYVPSCAGVPTGVPTVITGTIPIVVDSTNNKMYIYSGGSWVALN